MGKQVSGENLYKATKGGRVNAVKTFLDYGVDPNYVDKAEFGQTPLYIAAEYGYEEVILLLISNGANINQAKKRNIQINQFIYKDGWTSLFISALNGHKEVVLLLISNEANINSSTKVQNVSMTLEFLLNRMDGHLSFFSSGNGHKEIVSLLISKGANVNLATNVCNGSHNAINLITTMDGHLFFCCWKWS
ncbi:hypothetical protein THRCLA_21132 [Thraustotheca clavata]|uniref:Uncharacterized protein n=1 Tax=Thraustotheca clavata TaxID=74557 RepID=A0A1V9ZZX6_9STRA|nr:hypothetical protein THRCLA_21132 [Thraustotheca clavata]